MKSLKQWLIISTCIVLVTILSGCDFSFITDPSRDTVQENTLVQHSEKEIKKFLKSQGLKLVDSVTIEGSTGYLATYNKLRNEPGIPKYCLIFTGSSYAMG